MIWHSASIENIAAELQTNPEQGLSVEVAEARLQEAGYNLIQNTGIGSFGQYFWGQLKKGWSVVLLLCSFLLLVATLIAKGQGWYLPVLMACILVAHSLWRAWQAQYADVAVEQLKKATAPTACVVRDGQEQTVSASHLVPGDLLVLREGDYIPADARLVFTEVLRCDESILTGESVPVEKRHDLLADDITDITQRLNMIYSGCYVASGNARAIVTETGNETEQGRRAQIEALEQEDASVLAQSLGKTARLLGIALPVLAGLLLVVGMVVGVVQGADFTGNLFQNLVLCITLAATALPLELTTVCAVALALGFARFEESKAILKNPDVTKALADTTVLCTDKTGTLTQKRMSAVRVYDGNELYDLNGGPLAGNLATVLRLGAICGNATAELQEGEEVRTGDDTEAALCSACLQYMRLGTAQLSNSYPRLGEVPFTPERMRMTTVNMIDGRVFAITKGAPEAVLPLCLQNTEAAEKVAQAMAEDALRVLAIAVKPLDEAPAIPTEALEQNLNFMGLVGLVDPPRKEAYEAINACRSAGIRVVMVTGDHGATALAVAKALGICGADSALLTGEEVAELDDEARAEAAKTTNLFARVSTDQKPRILAALRQEGQVVTAVGKTVADAYALQQADAVCALRSAANITRATADVVLQSDNFNAAVMAVWGSRGVYANLKKILRYFLTCGVAGFALSVLGLVCFGAAPVQALQLLFAHLFLAALPAFALGFEPPEPYVMTLPPQSGTQNMLDKRFWVRVGWQGGLVALCALVAFGFGGNATAFGVFAAGELFLALSLRRHDLVENGKFITNPVLLYCVGCALAVALLFAATPLGGILGLSGSFCWPWFSLSVLPFAASEVYKLLRPFLKKK